MGFIKAIAESVGGMFADQWIDFYGPSDELPGTAVVFPGIKKGRNSRRGANTKGNDNIITDKSRVIVPEQTALMTMENGAITGLITVPGAYEYRSDDIHSQSIFTGGGLMDAMVKSSFEKCKYGGIPGNQQQLFYISLKEIPNNRFGTQSEIYWDDAYLGTQVGAILRGTYTLKVVDPVLFVKNFVPAAYLTPQAPVFDMDDMDNPAGAQLFNEVVSSLSAAFSSYTNDPSRGNRMSKIQSDQIGFAQSLSQAVEEAYQWKSTRGLEIVKTAILAIEYDEDSKKVVADARRADALSGARGNAFMQQAVARGMQAAGETGGGAGVAFMGMGMGAAGNMMGGMQQPYSGNAYRPDFGAAGAPQQGNPFAQGGQPAPYGQNQGGQQGPASGQGPAAGQGAGAQGGGAAPGGAGSSQGQVDVVSKLMELKKLLDAGVLSQAEFDKIKSDLLGL